MICLCKFVGHGRSDNDNIKKTGKNMAFGVNGWLATPWGSLPSADIMLLFTGRLCLQSPPSGGSTQSPFHEKEYCSVLLTKSHTHRDSEASRVAGDRFHESLSGLFVLHSLQMWLGVFFGDLSLLGPGCFLVLSCHLQASSYLPSAQCSGTMLLLL